MSIIIPYHEELAKDGAFIRPDGKILRLKDNKHQEFAEEYCNGHDFQIYTGARYGPPMPVLKNIAAEQEVLLAKDGVDIFRSSNLTKSQLEEYRFWLEKYGKSHQNFYVDFLVSVLAFDKVERLVHDVITTTAAEPHVRFFNYYLMNWKIDIEPRLVYNPEKDSFEFQKNHYYLNDDYDREAEDEIEEIKAKVLIKERPYFFKE